MPNAKIIKHADYLPGVRDDVVFLIFLYQVRTSSLIIAGSGCLSDVHFSVGSIESTLNVSTNMDKSWHKTQIRSRAKARRIADSLCSRYVESRQINHCHPFKCINCGVDPGVQHGKVVILWTNCLRMYFIVGVTQIFKVRLSSRVLCDPGRFPKLS